MNDWGSGSFLHSGITLWQQSQQRIRRARWRSRAYPFSGSGEQSPQSDRVYLTLPIRVSGVRGHSKDFLEEGQTIDISRQGATIKVGRTYSLARSSKSSDSMELAKSNGSSRRPPYGGSDGCVFGVTMLDPTVVNPWGVVFPAVASMDKGGAAGLAEMCCLRQNEVSYLNEFEADLLLYHHYISRNCEQCRGWTTWNRPHGRTSAGPVAAVTAGTQNRRSTVVFK